MKIKVYTIDVALPRRAKAAMVAVGFALMVGIAITARASVTVPVMWTDGLKLNASDLNSDFLTLQNAINAATPAGAIVAFAGVSCPSGTIAADGSSLARAGVYANLFTAIGTTWGAVDSSHFSLPSLKNRFLRGDGTATDGNGGAVVSVGQYQEAATRVYTPLVSGTESAAHTHTVYEISPNGQFGGVNGGPGPGGFHTVGDQQNPQSGAESASHTHTVGTGEGDTETRPKSYGVLFCIMY